RDAGRKHWQVVARSYAPPSFRSGTSGLRRDRSSAKASEGAVAWRRVRRQEISSSSSGVIPIGHASPEAHALPSNQLDPVHPMRGLPALSLLVAVVLVGTGAHAQSGPQAPQTEAVAASPPVAASKEPVKDIHAQTEAWFKDCKQGWDAATHMRRRDYERT